MLFAGPILTEVFSMQFGTLLAIISNINSLNTQCGRLIDVLEKLDVAQLVLSMLAGVLNDASDRARGDLQPSLHLPRISPASPLHLSCAAVGPHTCGSRCALRRRNDARA